MKKRTYLAISLLAATLANAQGQSPEIKTDMPTILPPSPTVAALMRFEEVPVSNYTGVPDISIPIFSTATRSKDIGLDISLKYSPSGIAADAVASDVGLGWSLFAGGTISRTVRGMPDEIFLMDSKIGLYHNSVPNQANNYDQALQYLQDENATMQQYEIGNEYLWNAQFKGVLDTEHDLWQFNFMGHSGRFYIKKDRTTGALEVKGLEDTRLKVTNTYAAGYVPTGFTVYDEKGYRFVFDVIETTTSHSTTFTEPYASTDLGSSMTKTFSYRSAFHLSKIFDNQNNVLAEFIYNPGTIKEIAIDHSQTQNIQDYMGNTMLSIDYFVSQQMPMKNFSPLPKSVSNSNQRNTLVKKLQKIEVKGIANIDFEYVRGRSDENLHRPDSAFAFRGITVRDWNGIPIKRLALEQDYQSFIKRRMLLRKVSTENFTDARKEVRELYYNPGSYSGTGIKGKDYWGYFNAVEPCAIDAFQEPSPTVCIANALQKMTLPTGGCVLFDFESNQYSSIGNVPLSNFEGNRDNWTSELLEYNFSLAPQEVQQALPFSATEDRRVTFYPMLSPTDIEYKGFTIYIDGVAQPGSLYCEGDGQQMCCINYVLLKGKQYSIKFWLVDINHQQDRETLQVEYHSRVLPGKQYAYGGGIRIGRIGYFDNSAVPQSFYDNYVYNSNLHRPSKEVNYDYRSFADPSRSSGSLSFAVPKFSYRKWKRECYWVSAFNTEFHYKNDENAFVYDVHTSFNNLQPVRTQGADVGYSNVSVYETGNGRREYEYSSPMQYPETFSEYNLAPPFLPTENHDYKRGNPLKERTFDDANRKLTESEYFYDFDEYLETTGFRTYYTQEYVQGNQKPKNYLDFRNILINCEQYPGNMGLPQQFETCFCYFGSVRDFVGFLPIREAFGWARLSSKVTRNHFYEAGNAGTVESSEAYTYNPLNRRIATLTSSDEVDTDQTRYFYHAGNSPLSQNRISEIERVEAYRNGEPVSATSIAYSASWPANASYLPQAVLTAKGSAAPEARLRYNAYDAHGNVLEAQQEGGMRVSYIWGYSSSLPVARIDNMAHASIPQGLADAIRQASDAVPYDEGALLQALDTLRDHPSMAGAMVTTQTYRRLVGPTTTTDPRGNRTRYAYDGFGRLTEVRDHSGNLLSENQYHYLTQQ